MTITTRALVIKVERLRADQSVIRENLIARTITLGKGTLRKVAKVVKLLSPVFDRDVVEVARRGRRLYGLIMSPRNRQRHGRNY